MYQALVTIAALSSVWTPSLIYYGKVKPMSHTPNARFMTKDTCATMPAENFVSYQMIQLGNDLFKIQSADGSSVMKLGYNKSEQEQVVFEPVVYYNAAKNSQARPIFPIDQEGAAGIAAMNVLPQKFACHDKELVENSKFNYSLQFSDLEAVEMTPKDYAHQIDVSTDLCTNLLEFKDFGAKPEMIINDFILDNFCVQTDAANETIKIASRFAQVPKQKVEKKSEEASTESSVEKTTAEQVDAN